MISNHTNQQVVYSNKGSNMAALLIFRGGLLRPPPVGATESDMLWEVGLTDIIILGGLT